MTPTLDLGVLDGPALVFGGPYSNLHATRALVAEAAGLGIPPERCLCTGDVVAYCADPAETVAAVMEFGCPVVMGNTEESIAAGAEDCGCGFEDGSTCDLLSRAWFPYTTARVTADQRAWMADLPRRVTFRLGDRSWTAIHGGVSEICRFLFASADDAVLEAELDGAGTDAVIGGHCGLPFSRRLGDRMWVNAGVIGMPANDGTPRGWYALIEAEGAAVRVSHHALTYDHAGAAARMRATGLPEGYAAALSSGLWPSLDVLPPSERSRGGTALAPPTTVWREPATARA